MRELPAAIPDVDVLLGLEPEELGAKLLFLIRGRREHMFHPGGMATELWGSEVPAPSGIHTIKERRSASPSSRLGIGWRHKA